MLPDQVRGLGFWNFNTFNLMNPFWANRFGDFVRNWIAGDKELLKADIDYPLGSGAL